MDRDDVVLSEHEREVLSQLERAAATDDPWLARRLERGRARLFGEVPLAARPWHAVALFVGGLMILALTYTASPFLGFAGALVMAGGMAVSVPQLRRLRTWVGRRSKG